MQLSQNFVISRPCVVEPYMKKINIENANDSMKPFLDLFLYTLEFSILGIGNYPSFYLLDLK
jgi:hypothetical protein